MDPKVNEIFLKWFQDKYGSVKDFEITCGKRHEFLGMVLDFSERVVCHVLQE